MTAAEVDSVIVEQTHQDKKFGELTIEMGYLTDEQVKELLNIQSPDFLLLGQILLDKGIIDNTTLEKVYMITAVRMLFPILTWYSRIRTV